MEILTDALWANLLSLLSVAISAFSLIYARGAYYRDQPKLSIEAWPVFQDGHPGYIQVKATNTGRQSISLVMLWGKDSADAMGRHFKDHLGPGELLEPHGVYEFQITHLPRSANQFDPVGNDSDLELYDFEEMWVQDSRGTRHPIAGMKQMLPQLRAHYSQWCETTGYWKSPPPEYPPVQAQTDQHTSLPKS